MSIEKHIQTSWEFHPIAEGSAKIASTVGFPTYVPPEVEQYIDQLQPDPRFRYEYALAMSDGDRFGSNFNGDVFSEEELTRLQTAAEAARNRYSQAGQQVPGYKTFEQARFFMNHDNRPGSPYYGDVPLAAWNDPMKWVSLIIRIARDDIPDLGMQSGADIIRQLERVGYVPLSMGTKILYERCRFCGHTNELLRDRCIHLRAQMNEIRPDGQIICAENYGPLFFDISKVLVAADPVARTQAKVASSNVPRNTNQAVDEENPRPGYWRAKRSDIEKHLPPDSAEFLTPEETERYDEHHALDSEDMDKVVKSAAGDLEKIIGTVTLAGVVLSPQELAYFTVATQHKEAGFTGFDLLRLDMFSSDVYDAIREKLAARAGFDKPRLPDVDWSPRKLAQAGYDEMAEYYAYYRACLRSLTTQHFVKAASRVPGVREILGDQPSERTRTVLFYLSRAGMDVG